MKTTYKDIDIEYEERTNLWVFTLRGRERKAESLTKAKEIIDKPTPKDEKPFDRFEAWKDHGRHGKQFGHPTNFAQVTVTSVAGKGWRGATEVWIVEDGKRSKVSSDDLYQDTPTNRKLMAEIVANREEKTRLDTEEDELKEKLKKVTVV